MGDSLFAGIDIGAQSAKAVLFDGEQVLGCNEMVTDEEADAAARKVYTALLDELELTADGVTAVFSTGSGGARRVLWRP